MRYGRYRAGLLVLGIALLFSIQSEAAAKKTIYNSPYVSFSPDGRAFTTCAGDRNYVWYARDDSTTVYTQIPSSLRDSLRRQDGHSGDTPDREQLQQDRIFVRGLEHRARWFRNHLCG